jgi:hypothetical protein
MKLIFVEYKTLHFYIKSEHKFQLMTITNEQLETGMWYKE